MSEFQDLVACLECGHQAKSLARHLKPAHGMNAQSYRAKHGAEARIISPASEARRSSAIRASREGGKYAGFKGILCPKCGEVHQVSKFSGSTPCPACRKGVEDTKWEGKTEPEDYITCLECGHRAVNLTSHIGSKHPGYRKKYPDSLVNALRSGSRDKSKLKGRTLSKETRSLMSENAGRWNKGLTKEDHPSLERQARKMRGKPAWSKGLTAEDHPSLASTSEKLKQYVGENRPWHNGLRVDLTLEDVQPILDAEGRMDRQKAIARGIPWQACQRYMATYGLDVSPVNIDAWRAACGEKFRAQTIRIRKEDLLPYALKNGKISCARAAAGLGYSASVVSREIKRNGLTVARGRIKQAACLQAVSRALGDLPWEEEWKSRRFRNPQTGWRYRYDGYFPAASLVVEFHGHQHFIWPNAFHKTEADYIAARVRDQHKREMIQAAPDLRYLEVRYDEPFDDVMYLRGRLYR